MGKDMNFKNEIKRLYNVDLYEIERYLDEKSLEIEESLRSIDQIYMEKEGQKEYNMDIKFFDTIKKMGNRIKYFIDQI